MICLCPGERPLPDTERKEKRTNRLERIGMEETKMKIAVVCANGKAGKLLVREALSRGLDVTAIARGEECLGSPQLRKEGFVRPDREGSAGL